MPGADGSISFITTLDNTQLEKDLSKTNKKILELEKNIHFANAKKIPLSEQADELVGMLDAAKAKLYEMQSAEKNTFSDKEIAAQQEAVNILQSKWDSVQKQIETYDNIIKESTEDLLLHKDYAGALEQETAARTVGNPDEQYGWLNAARQVETKIRSILSRVASVTARAVSAVGNGLKKIASGILGAVKNLNVFSKISDSLRGKFKRLGSTIKSAFVFSVIYKGLGKVKEQFSTYLTLNSDFAAALSRIKGVLLTAFQPIYDFVVPALTTLLNVLSNVIAAITEFTAALFGSTAKQAQNNAKALYNQAKATEEAGDSADDAKKSLASFDKINKLSENSGNSGSASNNSTAPVFDMELDDTIFSSWGEAFNNFLDNILIDGIPKLEKGLNNFSERVNRFSDKLLEMFSFPGVLDKTKQLGGNLAIAFNNTVKSINWNTLGQAIGSGLNNAITFAITFINTFDWVSFGSSLSEMINGAVTQIDWYNVGQLLFSGFKIGIETLAGLLIGLDMTQVALAASNLVMGFMDSISETLAAVDWEEIGRQVIRFMKGIDWGGVARATFKAIGSAFGALTSYLWGLIQEAWGEIVGWWESLANEDGKHTFEGVLKGILEGIKNIGIWIKDNVFQPFIDGFKEVFGIHSPSTVMAEQGGYLIDGLLSGISENIDSVLESFKGILNNILGFINDTFSGDWEEAWNGIKDIFKGVWNGIVGFFEDIVNSLIRGLNWLIEQMNKLSFDVPDWVPGIGGETFGFNIPPIDEVHIPRLAQGAVIPPNREFMAVLGDQRSGYNIEAPEALIRRIVREESGRGGDGETTIIMEIDRQQFAKLVYKYNNKESRRIGVRLVEA